MLSPLVGPPISGHNHLLLPKLSQVYGELETLGSTFGLKADVFHGGTAYGPQMKSLNEGLDILVATPGRIMDHLQRGALDLSDVRHAVLDEADEMLNMGFADDIETIFSYVDVSEGWSCECVFWRGERGVWTYGSLEKESQFVLAGAYCMHIVD